MWYTSVFLCPTGNSNSTSSKPTLSYPSSTPFSSPQPCLPTYLSSGWMSFLPFPSLNIILVVMLHYFQLLLISLLFLWLLGSSLCYFPHGPLNSLVTIFLIVPLIHTPHCKQSDLFKMQSDYGSLLDKILQGLSIVCHSMKSKVLKWHNRFFKLWLWPLWFKLDF